MPQVLHLQNLHCPMCAARVETAVAAVPGVKAVRLHLASGKLEVDIEGNGPLAPIVRAVTLADPQLRVRADAEPAGRGESKAAADATRILGMSAGEVREMLGVAIAAVLFVAGLIAAPTGSLEFAMFGTAYLLAGWRVLLRAGKNIGRGQIFDEHFLMSIATLGAMAIHEMPEAVGVMLFYQVGEFMQRRAVGQSRRSIRALLDSRPSTATREYPDGRTETVAPADLGIGDAILIRPGEKIPVDAVVTAGQSRIDTSPLTGESVPRSARAGDAIFAGTITTDGALRARVTAPFAESSVAKILELVESATARKAPTERFLTAFAKYYTPAVVAMALLVAFLPPLLWPGEGLAEWVYRALVLLVISCPCALVVSIPLGYFGGIGGASRRGILVKGANVLDALHRVRTVIFDKTGTLTAGEFAVREVRAAPEFTAERLLKLAAHAELASTHPMAGAICAAFAKPLDAGIVGDSREVAGQGIVANVGDSRVIVGNHRLFASERIAVPDDEFSGMGSRVWVGVDGRFAGAIAIADAVKSDAAAAVAALRGLGVARVEMLSGDVDGEAAAVARNLGLDGYRGGLLPHEKVAALEGMISAGEARGRVAFVGDGINDAAVIARADVGIAMGQFGSDAAIESADVVLMSDSPARVADAISVARRTRQIVWQNVALAVGIKVAVMVAGACGCANLWAAIAADVGVALAAILNALRALR